MGKKERLRKLQIEEKKKQQKQQIETIRKEKYPWFAPWKRVDFWIYSLCVVALIALPFVRKAEPKIATSETSAVLHTSMGDIEMSFYKDAPNTVDNFKKLSKQDFYSNLLWHRVIKGFVIQTGDPNGDGTGGPGYQFDDEKTNHKIVKGTVAMANSGPNTNGSQFFIVTDQAQTQLDGQYNVFGEVTSGMDVVKAISEVTTDGGDKPLDPVYLLSVELK